MTALLGLKKNFREEKEYIDASGLVWTLCLVQKTRQKGEEKASLPLSNTLER